MTEKIREQDNKEELYVIMGTGSQWEKEILQKCIKFKQRLFKPSKIMLNKQTSSK